MKSVDKSDIEIKSTSYLIDQLFTTLFKCWWAQEKIMDESLPTEERLDAAINAQVMNRQRAQLMRLIDERLGEGERSVLEKTYAKENEYTYFMSGKKDIIDG